MFLVLFKEDLKKPYVTAPGLLAVDFLGPHVAK